MARILSEIGRKLSRLFLGRIVIRELGPLRREEPPHIATHFRQIAVTPLRSVPRVGEALFVKWKQTRAVGAGSLIGVHLTKNFRTHGTAFDNRHPAGVKGYKFNIKRRAAARNMLGRIRRVPMLRRNRLNYLKKQPKFEKASLLALYSPIFQEKVTKSALDKASGNLLFWYDSNRVKMGEKYHLLLLRVFGGEEPLKWVWLPANKKIN